MRRVSWFAVAAVLIAPMGFGGAARAQDAAEGDVEAGPPAEYQALIEQALEESAGSRWAEARVIFRRAHGLYPNARTLRGIGMVSFEMREYAEAVRSLRLALADERRALTQEQRAQAEALLGRSLGFVGRYTLEAVPEGATLLVDGRAVEPEPDGTLMLSVGRHRVEVRTADDSWSGSWAVAGGAEEPLPIVMERAQRAEPDIAVPAQPQPPPEYREVYQVPVGGAVVTAIGGVTLIVGVVLFAIGMSDFAAVDNAPAGSSRWADFQQAYDRAPVLTGVGGAMMGIGGAATIGGGVWLGVGETRRELVSIGGRVGGVF